MIDFGRVYNVVKFRGIGSNQRNSELLATIFVRMHFVLMHLAQRLVAKQV
jgi:hypothetical protein